MKKYTARRDYANNDYRRIEPMESFTASMLTGLIGLIAFCVTIFDLYLLSEFLS